MNVTLKRIKRFIIQGDYLFTLKAESELEADGLVLEDALESILNAKDIDKVLNSTHPKSGKPENGHTAVNSSVSILISWGFPLYGKDSRKLVLISLADLKENILPEALGIFWLL